MTLALPKLLWKASPNFSSRTAKIDLIVVHDCQGGYSGSIGAFLSRVGEGAGPVSAHYVLREDGLECTQMVDDSKKAWHAAAFNSRSIGLEIAGFEAGTLKNNLPLKDSYSDAEWNAAELITAYLCKKHGIPAQWSQGGKGPGVARHLDLGRAGGGHTDPTRDEAKWAAFVARVKVLVASPDLPVQWSPVGAVPPRRKVGYGWRRDVPRVKNAFGLSRPKGLGQDFDLRDGFAPCYDQGQTSSCVGNSTAAAVQYIRKQEGHFDWHPSRLFPYWLARATENDTSEDGGAQIHDAFEGIQRYGCPPEVTWPFDPNRVCTKPNDAAWKAAMSFRATSHEEVPQTADALATALSAKVPVVFGFTVYDSFEGDAVARTGLLPMPAPNEAIAGAHAVVAVGMKNNTVIVRNSWGPDWGDHGYFYMPMAYYLDPNLCQDFQLLRKTTG